MRITQRVHTSANLNQKLKLLPLSLHVYELCQGLVLQNSWHFPLKGKNSAHSVPQTDFIQQVC